jgi:CheY-like chemotaxis protein
MTSRITEQPRAVLVDDDIHSARLLVRALGRLGGPTLTWYGRAERGLRLLANDFAGAAPRPAAAIVVDLKGSSAATPTFIRHLRERLPAGVPIAAIAAERDTSVHSAILAAGATAIFVRGPDAAAYRREVAKLAAFLATRLGRAATRTAAVAAEDGPGGDSEPYFI